METDCTRPAPQGGLYNPAFEHDACGIGFIARLSGSAGHDILALALTAVANLAHRGGVHADGKSGDGAGVLTAIPRAFFARELALRGIRYPVADLAIGMVFLPQDARARLAARRLVSEGLASFGLTLLGWRPVPHDPAALGARARETCPVIEQALVGRRAWQQASGEGYERALYLARKKIEAAAQARVIASFSIASLSSRTVVYKGLLVAPLLPQFYPDLHDPLYATASAVFHQRYSTNTFPTWERAQPFRLLSHNGEINTLRGNVAWMRAREAAWRLRDAPIPGAAPGEPPSGAALAAEIARLGPIVDESGSDSTMLDNVLELVVRGGRDIRHALAMLVPEAWERVPDLDPAWRAFYQYHAGLMEPWDGPAALAFSDGQVVGLALDRNGLRPARYLVTDDGLIVCASEAGAVHVDEARIIRKGKVGPGQMIAADLRTGCFQENDAIKGSLAAQQPYGRWLAEQRAVLPPASASAAPAAAEGAPPPALQELQRAFGYTSEELTVILRPMLEDGQEPIGSMGDDTPLAVFADRARPLYSYFKQRFAEVTNPPIDPLREELVMSLSIGLGPRGDLLEESPAHAHLLWLAGPVLTGAQLAAIRALDDPGLAAATLPALFPVAEGPDGLVAALEALCQAAEAASARGRHILILSDRGVDAERAPIPALLALGAVHGRLGRLGRRPQVSLIVESGEPRDVHHLACLVGMGAEAVHPYLALATVRALAVEREEVRNKGLVDAGSDLGAAAEQQYIHALEKGLLKIMSKMGIATLDSYCGAQVFEAIGLADAVVARCFAGIPARLGGAGFARLAAEVLGHHAAAFLHMTTPVLGRVTLPHPGFYKFKKEGEYHAFAPAVVHALQRAVEAGSDYATYRAYSDLVHRRPPSEVRDLFDFAPGAPVPLEEVEPVEAIVGRFSTAAMSHGSLSLEAHETIAVAMNRLGGLSNSGEGGEDPARYADERNSPIKQVASARFGVTPAYLRAARELQIKMAQGSKPGEGGQLPAHKVSEEIARIRHATAGIALISPPPHHDIYSIEDLAQLIYDLKQVNPDAAVSVKLVAQAGVGTIAAGVVKGGADVIMISGHAGGTGASPLSSIKNAGVPWELGLAETQQTLVLNGLRGRVRLRADGGIKTGRDVLLAALLGADEVSFGTTAVVAVGCLMARTCHSNNCPVGIATQRPELRAKFAGTPEQVIHFFLHLAQEVREILAGLGARSFAEIVGRSDLLRQVARGYPEADGLDLSALLERLDGAGDPIRNIHPRNGRVTVSSFNTRLLADAAPALDHGRPVRLRYAITNRHRAAGATLAGEIAARWGDGGLSEGAVTAEFQGSAGQSFGAFLAPGMHLLLEGEANDYVGKGMAGGEIVVRPPAGARYQAGENTILGNTVLYGATGGALYAAGRAGERFAVRNSGAVAVVEGVGDHGCEYMTGGVVLVLGHTGRNFAASMTGGLAYVFDGDGRFAERCNQELVDLGPLDAQDEDNVRLLLERHLARTASGRADEFLLAWDLVRARFWRVQPRGLVRVTRPAPLLEWSQHLSVEAPAA